MPNASFTTRIDADLKAELEQIARYEDSSASYTANQAIRNLVEERGATRYLVELGLCLINQRATGIEAKDIHDWMLADDGAPFPKAP